MRLVKDICKVCVKESLACGWRRSDDKRWKDGMVMCPHNAYSRRIDKTPPEWCGYACEHLVSQ